MEEKKINTLKILRIILGIMMIGSFLFFVWGEIFLPAENGFEETTFGKFESEWTQVMPEGERVVVEVPGQCEAEYGEWITIETALADVQHDTWICMRSMQQDIKIYVGDELRKEYSTIDTQPFGKTSTMAYVLFPIYESDSNATLRIEFMSDSSYAGYVSEMYTGDKSDIVQYFYGLYAPATIVSALLLLVGLLVVFGSVFVRIVYKRDVELIHLGNVIVLAASWLLVESKIRQFIFPNSTIAMLMGFLIIAVLPYPLLAYVNRIQENRYIKLYTILGACVAINYAMVVTMQVLNIKDFFETMTSSHIIIIALIIAMTVTITRDIIKGYVREYREVAIGFAALMMAGVFEIGLAYVVSAEINGISLCVGLVILLVAAGLKTLRDVINIEKEKQYAIANSESKAKFLANMSHEIRTPINTIIGMNEMILRENDNEMIEEYSHNIKNASQMLLGLINDVLDFSKIEAGKMQIVENNYNLATMLHDVVLANEIRAKQKNLELKLDFDETMPASLKGDEIRIKQILNNLLSNAIKYTEKGTVTFIAKGVRDENVFSLILSVKDTGIGIKKEDLDKLFDSFQRLELSKNRYIEGTGLGLNITQLLVNLMNGTIDVQSEYGKGSCFTVTLNQEIIDNTAMGKLNQKQKSDEKTEKTKKAVLDIPDAKILVVDDTKMNLLVMRELLKRTRAQLDLAGGGNQCLQMTKDKKYDVILMDHMMPEPDGVQTLHMIREDNENLNQNTPIIVLTANAIVGMREQYIEEGFADYLSKPVEVDKLEEMLARFVG